MQPQGPCTLASVPHHIRPWKHQQGMWKHGKDAWKHHLLSNFPRGWMRSVEIKLVSNSEIKFDLEVIRKGSDRQEQVAKRLDEPRLNKYKYLSFADEKAAPGLGGAWKRKAFAVSGESKSEEQLQLLFRRSYNKQHSGRAIRKKTIVLRVID